MTKLAANSKSVYTFRTPNRIVNGDPKRCERQRIVVVTNIRSERVDPYNFNKHTVGNMSNVKVGPPGVDVSNE